MERALTHGSRVTVRERAGPSRQSVKGEKGEGAPVGPREGGRPRAVRPEELAAEAAGLRGVVKQAREGMGLGQTQGLFPFFFSFSLLFSFLISF